MYYIGVDLGGTSIKAGVVDKEGNILVDAKKPTHTQNGYQAMLKDMADLCTEVMQKAKLSQQDIHSVGVGCPGVCDHENGILVYATNLGFYDVPIREELNRYFDWPIFIENDANCAALAESVAGAAKDVHSSVLLTLGTGVGGGVIIDDKIYSGFNGAASELGHMVIINQGHPCPCGRKGCLEQYASASGLIRMTKQAMEKNHESIMHDLVEKNQGKVSAKTAFIAQRRGDVTADQVVKQYIDYLSDGIVNIMNILFPEKIIIGGGVSREGDPLMIPLRKAVDGKLFCKAIPNSKVEKAQMENGAGIVGAAMLGIYQ